jgi:hypothetical protein
MKKFFVHLYQILLGTYRNIFQVRTGFEDKRWEVCCACEHCKANDILGTYCDVCGCILKSKIKVDNAKCSLNKW